MSYEDQHCPCGGRKERQTMLCVDCVSTFSDRAEIKDYQDRSLPLDWRRNSALILLSLARKRTGRLFVSRETNKRT